MRAPTFRDRVEYGLFRGAVALLEVLPIRASLALGRRLGDLAFSVIRLRRRVALENLALVEGHPGRRRALARRVYRNLGETFAEFSKLTPERAPSLWARLTTEGEESLFEAARRGRGAVLTSAHFGSWEIFGAAVAARGHPVTYVVADQRNPLVGSFIDRRRRAMGVHTYPVGASARRALRELREKRFVVLLADQDAGRDGVFLPFLGSLASTETGPALVAQRTGAPVISGFILRRGGGRHHMVFDEPFLVEPGRDAGIEAVRRYTARIEERVRLHPDHWFWVHRRWKTRPPA